MMQALILRPAALFFCVILRPATCDPALYIYEKKFFKTKPGQLALAQYGRNSLIPADVKQDFAILIHEECHLMVFCLYN
jgi:hypothetical protein